MRSIEPWLGLAGGVISLVGVTIPHVAPFKAGGLLLAGPDPTSIGAVVVGYGDQLIVEGGFTPVEAIEVAARNGARFLREDDRIGSLAPQAKSADLVVIRGDPSSKIEDIQKPTSDGSGATTR